MTNQETVLCLRTTAPDGRPYSLSARATGFVWPTGPDAVGQLAEAPDWDPDPSCGRGLHGLLWGEGVAAYLSDEDDALWQVVEVEADAVVDLDGKVKFPRCVIRYQGDRTGASNYLWQRCPAGTVIAKGVIAAGYKGTATAGYKGTATAGYKGTATAGHSGTATAGHSGTATAGECGTLIIKYWDRGRYRIAVGYVGEDGIEANKPYKVEVREGKPVFVEAT